jgi:uncharacterized protein
VSVVEGLRQAIAEMSALDHHAHLLTRPDGQLRLADMLTESRAPAQIDAVQELPAHGAALRVLGRAMGVAESEAEEACATARAHDFEGHARRLLDQCRFEAMFVDDGYDVEGNMSLSEHAAIVRCPVRRVVRIESEAERASFGWPQFTECRVRFQQAIARALTDGAIGLKTIAAYRCGLELPPPSVGRAASAYEGWRRSGAARLRDAELISFFIADALDVAGRGVPLQVHTGLGDAGQLLLEADPALLQAHIDAGMLRDVTVVLLHCYPFVRNAGYLASIYPNVYFDLSLAMTLAPHRGPVLLAEAFELAPASKLLFATDASRMPEVFLLATTWWRESLAQALGQLVGTGFTDERRAVSLAERILAGNARRIYRFDPT